MRLTNQQVDAIIDNVCSENRSKIDAEKKAIRENKEVLKEAKKYYDLIQQIPKEVRRLSYVDKDMRGLIEAVVGAKRLMPTTKETKRNDLRSKIILASIDCKTLAELKTKLKLVF